jgi:hypothetical protein
MKLKRRWALWSGQHSNFSPIEASTLSLTRVLEGRLSRFRRVFLEIKIRKDIFIWTFHPLKIVVVSKPSDSAQQGNKVPFPHRLHLPPRQEIEARDKPCSSGETCLIRLASLLRGVMIGGVQPDFSNEKQTFP